MDLLRGHRLRLVWLVLRVWIGVQWLEAGWHKVLDPKWMVTGEAVRGYWVKAAGLLPDAKPLIKYGWYESFIRWLAESGQHVWFGKFVAVGELLVGVGLILGGLTLAAAFFGALMNLSYCSPGRPARTRSSTPSPSFCSSPDRPLTTGVSTASCFIAWRDCFTALPPYRPGLPPQRKARLARRPLPWPPRATPTAPGSRKGGLESKEAPFLACRA